MKKIYFAIVALAALTFASCEKAPIGGTATESLAGQWYVTVQGLDTDGSVLYEDEDLFGLGNFWLLTYNTAANDPDSIWIQDVDGAFWDFKVKAHCDKDAGTFEVAGAIDQQYGISVDITNGKVLKGAAKTPSGMPADSITMDILYSDDSYAGVYYDRLRITGYRYTGLAADD
ncbi:MAG: hypothetical protein IJ814_05385 [Paludibacteraceae bacterium]|nr:hypothetical protein [Paludibacteraceae bacterium]